MRDRERGSVLMLMPAAVLIVVILGALAVDRAVVFGAQRDLVATAQAAAADAAADGIDVDDLRGGGVLRLDAERVDQAVAAAAARADGEVEARWRVDGDVLVVTLERPVELVFTKGVPGAPDTRTVRATARATLVRR